MFVFDGVRRLLDEHIQRLTPLEYAILAWLAINRDWTDLATLQANLVPAVPKVQSRVGPIPRRLRRGCSFQIVVLTGQPGEAPEESVVLNYAIDDYKTKLELTQQKLFTTLVTDLRAYQTIRELEGQLHRCEERRQALELLQSSSDSGTSH